MKRLLILIIFLLSGCTIFEPIEESKIKEKESLKYEIESIRYSKTFEQIDPFINKVEEKDDFIKLSIGLGVTDYKNIDVQKIEKEGSIVKVFISGEKEEYSTMLSYPNLILNIYTQDFKPNETTFLLDNSNISIYPIKYSLSQVASLLETNLNLTTKNMPIGKLKKEGDNFYWVIDYKGIVDRQDENLSLIDLNAKLDALTGEVIESSKKKVSEKLDFGKIISFKEGDYIYYKKINISKEKPEIKNTEIMKFSIKNNKVSKIYETTGDIIDFSVNNSGEVAFIEEINELNNLYIILPDSNKPYKAMFSIIKKPDYIKWINDNLLYIMDIDVNDIHLFEYDVLTSTDVLKATLKTTIKGIIPGEKNILIDGVSGSNNSNIYSTVDFNNVEKLATGHSPIILGNKLVFSFYNDVEKSNGLYLLDIGNNETTTIDKEVLSVNKVNDNKILYTKKEGKESDLGVYVFDIQSKEKKYLTNVITKDVYYDSINKELYKNIFFTLNETGRDIIYKLDIQ